MDQLLWTYQDAVEHVLDCFELKRATRNLRQARRAVLAAYREMPNLHRWMYYLKSHTFTSNAQQTTGTVVYDHSGGTYERMLTLTGATWPDWAEQGTVQISGIPYRIATKESSTIVTLDPNVNPGADVASTTYILFRSIYPAPVDFRRMDRAHQVDDDYELDYVDPAMLHANSIYTYSTPSDSFQITVRGATEYFSQMMLELSPPPASADNYGFMYERQPRQLNTELYATGTVAVTSGSATITGTGTTFTSDHVGSTFRLSSTADEPTSRVGDIDNNDNPPAAERTIIEFNSATEVIADTTFSSTVSGKGFSISDPLDIEYSAMLEAFWRLCELKFCHLARRHEEARDVYRGEFHQALAYAMDADRRSTAPQSAAIGNETYYGRLGDVNPLG